KNKEEPRLVLSWGFPTDDTMHNFGYDSEEYHDALKFLDVWFGHLIEGWKKYKGLKQLGFLDETAFVFTSDHGNYKGKQIQDLSPIIDNIGLQPIPVKLGLLKGKASGKGLGNFDLAIGSLGQWYFRSKNPGERPNLKELKSFSAKEINLIEKLFNIEGTKLLYYREDDNTKEKGIINIIRKVNNKQVKSSIEYNGDKTKLIFENDDVFNYLDDEKASKLLDGKFHDINEWLIATHDSDFPIICDQVARLFRNPNSCDILTSTLGDVVYNYEHGITKNDHIYSHDISKGTKVPLIIGGTNIDNKKIEVTKISDLVPTIAKLLDGKIDKHVVGKSLI
ncbi:MAG: alkaline phosphatase family protein, partial [Candidatus Helarchaeota archaeon]